MILCYSMLLISLCRLNLPTCLPDVYLPVKDPQPCGGKGFIGALFGSGPSEINREEICKRHCVSAD